MAPLMDNFPDIAGATDVVTQLSTGISGVVGDKKSGLPVAKIGDLTKLFSGLTPPDPSDLLGDGISQLGNLKGLLPDDLAGLLDSLITEINGFKEFIDSNPLLRVFAIKDKFKEVTTSAVTDMEGLADSFKEMSSAFQESFDPLKLTGTIDDTLKKVKKFLPEGEGFASADKINGLFKNMAEGLTKLISVPSVINGAVSGITEIEKAVSANTIAEDFAGILGAIPPLINQITTIDLLDAGQVASVKGGLLALNSSLSQFSLSVSFLADQCGVVIGAVDASKYKIEMGNFVSGLEKIGGIGVQDCVFELDLTSMLGNLNAALDKIAIPDYLTEIKNLLTDIEGKIGEMDPSAIQAPLAEQIAEVTQYFKKIDEVKVEITVTVRGLFEKVKQEIDKIDLGSIKENIENALTTIRDTLGSAIDEALNTVKDAITTVINSIKGAVEGLRDLIDPGLKGQLEGFIGQIQTALQDANLPDALDDIQKELEGMIGGLDAISFTPVTDPVVEEISDMKEKLQKIDVSSLNVMLKAALTAATEVIKAVKFEVNITGALTAQFDEIIKLPKEGIAVVKVQFDLCKATIMGFDPGVLLKAPQQQFDAALAELKEIQPSALLKPVADGYNAVVEGLNKFNPAEILSPISDIFEDLMAAFDKISPEELIKPLQALFDEVTALVDKIDIDPLINELKGYIKDLVSGIEGCPISSFLNQAIDIDQALTSSVFGKLDQTKLTNSIKAKLIDPLNSLLNNLDMNRIFPVFRTLSLGINTISPARLLEGPMKGLERIEEECGKIDMTQMTTQFHGQWQGIKNAFSAVSVPPGAEAAAQEIGAVIDAMNPIGALSPVSVKIGDLKGAVSAQRTLFAQLPGQFTPALGSINTALEKIIPDFVKAASLEEATEVFTAEISASIPADLAGSIENVITKFKQVFETLDLENLITQLTRINAEFQGKVKAFCDLDVIFGPIKAGIEEFKNTIKGFLDLSFLTEELDTIFAEVKDKIRELDPSQWVDEIANIYQETIDKLSQIDIQGIGDELDAIYQTEVLSVFEALSPDSFLLPSLEEAFKEITAIVDKINIDGILEELVKALDALFVQLKAELGRTEVAFNQMIGAIPSGGGFSASAGISF